MSSIFSWRRTSAHAVLMFSLIAAGRSAQAQQLSWMRAFGAEGDEVAMSVAVDVDGNPVVAGYFEGTVDVDPGPGEELLVSNGQNDAFVMKLDAAGALLWVLQVGGASADYATGVSVDASGNVYVTGAFNDVVDFDPGAGVAQLTSAGEHDIFLAKYSPDGAYLGSWGVGGPGYDEPKCVAAGPQGSVYLLSYFNGTIDADPGTGVLAIASQGQLDMLVQRFSGEGELVWAQGTGSSGADLGLSMALDAEENIFLTGFFSGTADMDPDPTAVFELTTGSSNFFDAFLCELDPDGAFLGASQFAGAGSIATQPIAIGPDDAVTIAGHFESAVDLDPGAGEMLVTSSGFRDAFVVRLADPTSGLPVVEDPSTLLLFPNPATDHILFDLDPPVLGASYVVLDEQGRQVAQGRVDGVQMRLPVDGLAAGRYQLQVRSGGVQGATFVVVR